MKTQKSKNHGKATNKRPSIGAAERRYRTAISKLRVISRHRIDKKTQVELAHLINKIDSYGFNFFPNLYVYDDVIALEGYVEKLNSKGE